MKVSEAWLREWVNPAVSSEELAAQLTMAGLEVDAQNPVAGPFHGVTVAEILQTRPHPQADKLTLCEVKTAQDKVYQIVCGAANVRRGLKVALAQLGAKLPNGLEIKKAKLRGELSEGMLCSAAELGLEERSDGIMELAHDAPLGQDLRDYMGLNDAVLDIALTPNRADCFSVRGIARELAAVNQTSLHTPDMPSLKPELDDAINIEILAEEACPYYCGRVIKGIATDATSPLWLKERLRRSGIRSLHPVVDILNYVMLELGQPMHAFDAAIITGAVNVRYSQPGEALALINGDTVSLRENTLVIADDNKPLAIAGVMGGEESAVHAATRDILIESAFFNPQTIAGVARSYGLCTDSSQRFERGVHPRLQIEALERASYLIQSIAGGSIGPVREVAYAAHIPPLKTISFNPCKVGQLTGLQLAEDEMAAILQRLGMTVSRTAACWQVDVPAFRFDLHLDVDLVEEITRLYGYDKIETHALQGEIKTGQTNKHELLGRKIGAFLANCGYSETISYSFVDPQIQEALCPDAPMLSLVNPISQELSVMRTGMWPGLVASMVYNLHRQQTAIRFFECGVTFGKQGQTVTERACLAGLSTGELGALNWSEKPHTLDFYDVKGDLEALFAAFNIKNAKWVQAPHSALHPGKSAQIWLDGQLAGWLGVLHPKLSDALDVSEDVVLFELYLDQFPIDVPARYRSISKYPSIRRDLSLLVDDAISVAEIEQVVRNSVPAGLLKGFAVFDLYKGEGIADGKKSLALALTLQNDERTLVDQEINAIIDAIIKELEDKLTITLRD